MTDFLLDTLNSLDTIQPMLSSMSLRVNAHENRKLDLMVYHTTIARNYFFADVSSEIYQIGQMAERADNTEAFNDNYLSIRFRVGAQHIYQRMICYEIYAWMAGMGGMVTASLGSFKLISIVLSEVLLLSSILDSLFFIRKGEQAYTDDAPDSKGFKGKNKVTPATGSVLETEQDMMSQETVRSQKNVLASDLQFSRHKSSGFKQTLTHKEELEHNLNQGMVSSLDLKRMINTIFFKRIRFGSVFSFYLLFVISYMHICPCIRRRLKTSQKRKIKLFQNGKKKFLKELDVVNILHAIRTSNFVSK